MDKDVKIKVTGTHGKGDEKGTLVTECSGYYFEKNGKIFLKYTETDEDTGAVRHSTIVVENHDAPAMARVTVEHKGNTDARFIFEPGKKNKSTYVTPMGGMSLEVDTVSMEIEKKEKSLYISADYHMSLGGDEAHPASIKIHVSSNE